MARATLLMLILAAAAAAQPRAPELSGYVGWFRLGGDEGSLGNAPAFGGGATVPLTQRWALDADIVTGREAEQFEVFGFSRRRTLVLPSIVRRWGSARLLLR